MILHAEQEKNALLLPKMSKAMQKSTINFEKEHETYVKEFKKQYLLQKKNLELE
jgi:hypothetical protein